MKRQGNQWVLTHINLDQHNHQPSTNPFTLQPHISRRPGFAEAMSVAKTHRGVLRFSESKEVLKNLGLSIDRKQYLQPYAQRAVLLALTSGGSPNVTTLS